MRAFKTIILAAALLVSVGCASEKGQLAPAPGAPNVPCTSRCDDVGGGSLPPPPGGSNPDGSYNSGSTAGITLNGGSATLARMFFQSNPNNPTNVKINIDLRRTKNSVVVSYVDGGYVREAHFGVEHPYNGNVRSQRYNGWVNQDGRSVWKGFFQDQYGAIVLVLDRVLSQGDGQPSQFLGGSIWFQNFNQYWPNSPYQGSEKMCWEIELGPYDCRTFLIGGHVSMGSSLYPNNRGKHREVNYEKLGDFDGISYSEGGF